VWPIIDKNCTSCHGADKQKAKLRLDSRDGWIKGGEDGKILVEGDPDKSDVIAAIKYMAKDEDDNMPPKKKTRLTSDQVAILSDWIKQGLPWPDARSRPQATLLDDVAGRADAARPAVRPTRPAPSR
jgi:mono/diheme cytochrome c family protein